jgi:hypothetical protein
MADYIVRGVVQAWPVNELLLFAKGNWEALPLKIQEEYDKGNIVFTSNEITIKESSKSQPVIGHKNWILSWHEETGFVSYTQDIFDKSYVAADTKVESIGNESTVGTVGQVAFNQAPFVKDEIGDTLEAFFLKCTKCGGAHFRHAGYMEAMFPIHTHKSGSQIVQDSLSVKICVNCKQAYVPYEGAFYNVTKFVDLQAWTRTELEAHKATGPGGQC